MSSKKILVVDDEERVRNSLKGILSDEGMQTILAGSGQEGLELLMSEDPNLVILDIWMPGLDGMETLKQMKKLKPDLPIVMISGHATISTAVQATRLGAADFIEKPLDLEKTVQAVKSALDGTSWDEVRELPIKQLSEANKPLTLDKIALSSQLFAGRAFPQKTLKRGALLYGHGVHTGQKSGLILEPLPENSGIHFSGIDFVEPVPAFVDFVESTGLATTIKSGRTQVSTIEHLMSALHAYGISNLLVKCNGEVPVFDGSALQYCKLFEELGIQEQQADVYAIKLDKIIEIGKGKEYLKCEPSDVFEVEYRLDYPAPLGVQEFSYIHEGTESYKSEIASARTFGFVKDIDYLQKQGLGLGGRFDNFVLYGEQGPINMELRFPDEAVRHKILDLMGDLYLLGRPLQFKITANMTGHSDNVALAQALRAMILGA